MNWNQKENKKTEKDSFWLGFILSFGLAIGTMFILLKQLYHTTQPFLQVMWKLSQKGLLTNELYASMLPGFVLIFIFTKLRKEKATIGTFIGIVPFLILTFWNI